MDPEAAAVSWNKFHVTKAGKTNGAHEAIVQKLCAKGQTEVSSPEDSDYLLVFCPVASRVGTDIGEALQNMPAGKPVILVVMHHTFNRDHIVAESRRQVDDPKVCLTVDFLFYEGKLLSSNRNDIAWDEIQKFLNRGRSGSSDSCCPDFFSSIRQCFMAVLLFLARGCNTRQRLMIAISVLALTLIIVTLIIVEQQ